MIPIIGPYIIVAEVDLNTIKAEVTENIENLQKMTTLVAEIEEAKIELL